MINDSQALLYKKKVVLILSQDTDSVHMHVTFSVGDALSYASKWLLQIMAIIISLVMAITWSLIAHGHWFKKSLQV